MVVENPFDEAVARIAAAIGEPARARILYCLMDGRARTSTELATVAEVSASTTSIHLSRLRDEHLVKMLAQGKHRYYSLEGPNVAHALEGLSVLAGGQRPKFVPSTPSRLRVARTCYDHLAGTLGVSFHDRFLAMRWLDQGKRDERGHVEYQVTDEGAKGFAAVGIEIDPIRALRRRLASGCLDWSERRPHLGGALGGALLTLALKKRWVTRDLDSRALEITSLGRREMANRFGIETDRDR